MFPSPVGELHFSIEIISMMDDNSCFRPLSGNCISQSESIIAYILDYFSFRPLSGNCISQYTRQAEKAMNEVFPSPVGELHFSIVLRAMATDRKRLVSVPCRGTAFLNKPEAFDKITGFGFRPLSGNCISQYHPCNPATSLGSWAGLRGKNIFGKINKIHSLKSAANSVFKPCAAKSKQIFSFIKKYQFHIVPSYILFPDSGYISKYVVKPSFLYLYNVYDLVAHLFCQRYLLLFQYLLFHQT